VGWDWVHFVRRSLIGLLYQLRMIDDECGAVGGMRIVRGRTKYLEKICPSSSITNPTSPDLGSNPSVVVASRWLTAWAMARPILFQLNCVSILCGLVVRVPGYGSWGPGFDSRRYQIFWEVVGLERGPLSLVRIIEELLEWKSSGSSQENRVNDQGDPLRWPRDTLYSQKLALTSPTSGGRSVGIVRLRTKGHGV
jgi:hypothetical protein